MTAQEYLVSEIKAALATDARVNEPSLDVCLEEGTVVVRGRVPTEQRRSGVSDVLAEVAPGTPTRNETEVADLSEPEGEETLP